MSERYQNCPVCGSLCMIGGDKKEGTHYYVPVSDNAKFAAAPVAKPIVWEGNVGTCGDFKFFIAPDYNYESEWSDLEVSYKSHKEMICVGAAPDDDATVKEVAQDWLNKLVAECAVMGNPTPQFTADEIEAIRKIAQFMGVTVADSILAKCDAMLKGAGDEG